MALGATIHKATLNLSDIDRGVYGEYALTIARHPSETDERMMVRILAYALNVAANEEQGTLQLAKDLWDVDEPALWHKDYTGALLHWIEVGQPDDKRLLRAAGRAAQVSVYSFAYSTPVWWAGLAQKIARAGNIAVWQIEAAQSQALQALCARSMALQISVQDGTLWLSTEQGSVEITPLRLV